MEETVLSRHFSAKEIARLEHGLPRLANWSGALLVPFTAHRLRFAAVAWINRRWFLERGFNLAQEETLRRVCSWLLDEFAWCVRSGSEGFAAYSRTLWADRYGSTGGVAVHGGSGRVATLGCFQAKGIGQTPLVGRGAAAGHTHGCQSIAESLREAIWAEVALAEFPHGAVPVIAVLDTGLDFSSPDPADQFDQGVRRGLLIRPAVVRASHAERAPLFKHPATKFVNRQVDDVARTREVISYWAGTSQEKDTQQLGVLGTFVQSTAEQIAFGQVHRLFSGGYFSSNVGVLGELLDFGNMHALPDWSRAQVLSNRPGLGDEMRLFSRLISSLAFYFTKYHQGGDSESLARDLLTLATSAYKFAWRQYGVALFQVQTLEYDVQEAVHGALRRYFAEQQRHQVMYRFGFATRKGALSEVGWLYDALVDEKYPANRMESRILREIVEQLRKHDVDLYVALSTAARLLMPRLSVDRRKLLDILSTAVPRVPQSLDPKALDEIVRAAVSGARRHWARLPSGYAVLAHATYEGSSALLCARCRKGPRTVWLEGIRDSSAGLHWFGRRFEEADFRGLDLYQNGAYWWSICPVFQTGDGLWHTHLAGCKVALPGMDVSYPIPGRRWLDGEGTHTH